MGSQVVTVASKLWFRCVGRRRNHLGRDGGGDCAFGWKAALGGIAVAREMALGGVALARHANDGAANAFIQSSSFFRNAFVLVTKWLDPSRCWRSFLRW
jgi:hypothetical protein